MKFALFTFFYENPIVVNAEIRTSVRDSRCTIYTDIVYNPISDHKLYSDRMSLSNAERILSELGFVMVADDFNHYNIDDLKKVKHLIPAKWVAAYNESIG